MKKHIIIYLVLLFSWGCAYAAPVDSLMARKVADTFRKKISSSTSNAVMVNRNTLQMDNLYVFNYGNQEGYIVIAANSVATPILGYSTHGSVNPDNLPPEFRYYMDYCHRAIDSAVAHGIMPEEETVQLWRTLSGGRVKATKGGVTVGPLIETSWGQYPYYNDLCPIDPDQNEHAVTGCVATATGQIMRYWKHPVKGTGSHSYRDDDCGYLSANFGNTTYDWANMPLQLSSSSTPAQVRAVATLLHHIGVAVEMMYDAKGSSSYITNMYYPSAEKALKQYFGYKSSITFALKQSMTASAWESLLKNELDLGRPMLYQGIDPNAGGHAFILDGYQTQNGTTFYHFNWGWDGDGDGFFTTPTVKSYDFIDEQGVAYKIEPDIQFSVSPSNVDFSTEGGQKTVQVTPMANSSLRWTATHSASWLRLSATSGAGSGQVAQITLTATANPSTANRYDTIRFSQGSYSRTVIVKQSSCINQSTINKIACNSYTWSANQRTYTRSTTDSIRIRSANGCDSIVRLNLTIGRPDTAYYELTSCEPYTWNNTTYETSGTYKQYSTNSYGCTRTNMLTFKRMYGGSSSQTKQINAGSSYSIGNRSLSIPGHYEIQLTSANGCDSTIYLTLNVAPNYSNQQVIYRNATIRTGETGSITFMDTLFYDDFESGRYNCWTNTSGYKNDGFAPSTYLSAYWDATIQLPAYRGKSLFEPSNESNSDSLTHLFSPLIEIFEPSQTVISYYLYKESVMAEDDYYGSQQQYYDRGGLSAIARTGSSYVLQDNRTDIDAWTQYRHSLGSIPAGYTQFDFFHQCGGAVGMGIDNVLVYGPRRISIPRAASRAAAGSTVTSHDTVYRGGCTPVIIVTRWTIIDSNQTPENEGLLRGTFSVSSSKKVRFSKGNLQYLAAAADGYSARTWRFAEHQYDYVGGPSYGNVVMSDGSTRCNNGFISSSYAGWIDLFGWGTSGWYSGASIYYPYDATQNNSKYRPGNNYNSDLTGSYVNADWGMYNAIVNGGNASKMWRTLTYEEWRYLRNSRPNASQKIAKATVCGARGIVLLPDTWTLPQSCTFTPYSSSQSWSANTYTPNTWPLMENAGAVFLPAAGYRGNGSNGGTNYYTDNHYYWSSTHANDSRAYSFNVNNASTNSTARSIGSSVRLVRDFEPCTAAGRHYTKTACESYTWQGTEYRAYGTYVGPEYETSNGCTARDTLRLSIFHNETTTISITAQDSYTWLGQTFTESGTYEFRSSTVNGNCDSIISLHLTIVASQQPTSTPHVIHRYDTIHVGETGYHTYMDTLYFYGFDEGGCWTMQPGPRCNAFNIDTQICLNKINFCYPSYQGKSLFQSSWPPAVIFDNPGAVENIVNNYISTITTPFISITDPTSTTLSFYYYSEGLTYANVYFDSLGNYVDRTDSSAAYYHFDSLDCYDEMAIYRNGSNNNSLWHVSYSDIDRWTYQSVPLASLSAGETSFDLKHVNLGAMGLGLDNFLVYGPRRINIPASASSAAAGSTLTTYDTVLRTGCTPTTIVTHWIVRPNDTPHQDTTATTEGALPGQFSVGESKSVRFSKGNLQWSAAGTHACADGTTKPGTWRFAEHQYDIIGSGNNYISATYTGWIDLFGWATSGYHNPADSGNTNYQPYSYSVEDRWNNEINPTGYGPSKDMEDLDLTGSSAYYDWGVYNAISNGGNQANLWRTLTADEWNYLLFTRPASTVNGKRNARFAFANIDGINGLILFSDNYLHPAHVRLPDSINSDYHAVTNHYSSTAFASMEAAGAVFLPVAGVRKRYIDTSSTYYWSVNTNRYTGQSAITGMFISHYDYYSDDLANNMTRGDSISKYYGLPVRLVQDKSSAPCNTSTSVNACESFDWHGTQYNASGVYTYFDEVSGCLDTLRLNLHPTMYYFDSIYTSDDSVYWHGNTYRRSGIYSDTMKTIYGCDSIETVSITFVGFDPCDLKEWTYVEAEACDSFVWNGNTYLESRSRGQACEVVGRAIDGCDSIACLILTLHHSWFQYDTITAFDSFYWNGRTYRESTTIIDTALTMYGCDSNTTTTIIIGHNPLCDSTEWGRELAEACDSFSWHGKSYIESTQFGEACEVVGRSMAGCDSAACLILSLHYSTVFIDEQTAISSFTWMDGNTYTESTDSPVMVFRGGNVNGCDSTIVLNLTIEQPDTVSQYTESDFDFTAYAPSGQLLYYKIILLTPNDGGLVRVVNPSYNHATHTSYYGYSKPSGSLVIPAMVHDAVYNAYVVTSIGDSAFTQCSLDTVLVPSSVSSIGAGAFHGTNRVIYAGNAAGGPWDAAQIYAYRSGNFYYSSPARTRLIGAVTGVSVANIPYSVKIINGGAFYRKTSLRQLSLPAGLQTIEAVAFAGCSALTEVTLPESLTYLGENAFRECTSLRNVNYNAANCASEYGRRYYSASSIFSDEYIEILSYWPPFEFCNQLSSITFGPNVSHLSYPVFSTLSSETDHYANTGTYYTMPANINRITMLGMTPAAALRSIFCDFDGYFIVPCAAYGEYLSAPNYPRDMIYETSNYTLTATCDTTQGTVRASWWSHSCTAFEGSVTAEPKRGFRFSRWSNGATDNPYTFVFSSDMNITAIFMRDSSNVVVRSNDLSRGTTYGGGFYRNGSSATIMAIPLSGSHFIAWNDGIEQNPRTLTVTNDVSFTARFEPVPAYNDTLILYDTTIVRDTVLQTDTIVYTDTLTVRDTVLQTDTIVYTDTLTVRDTLVHNIIDTLVVFDTAFVHDTLLVTDTIVLHDVVYAIKRIHDTIMDTIYVHDTTTIYRETVIHDTVCPTVESLGSVIPVDAKIYTADRQVIIEGSEGLPVVIYDLQGRTLDKRRNEYGTIRFKVPATGVYMVRIADLPAQRVVVLR